jgi:serine/threonine protein kinase
VYLAEVHSPDGLVHRMAVKILHEQFTTEDEIGARARDEARLMSQLNHDNVVQVYGLTQIAERSAVLMEYVEGIDCNALMRASGSRGEGLPLGVAFRIIECSADALHAAYHAISPQTGRPLRVVHRDIKPGNILVSLNGAVKVMDFGVARADFEREAETKSMQFGTQRYMAPERWLEGEAGPRSDVFSLGLTFWELVTGEKFAQLPLSPRKYAERIDQDVAHFMEIANPEGRVEGACEAVLRGMLAYRVEERLSAGQVGEILAELSETQRGPSLRRYARKWIPDLLREREATLAEDTGLAEFSGTLITTDDATDSIATTGSAPMPSSRDPRSAATLYEEPAELSQATAPAEIPAKRRPSVGFLISVVLCLLLGALMLLNPIGGPSDSTQVPVGPLIGQGDDKSELSIDPPEIPEGDLKPDVDQLPPIKPRTKPDVHVSPEPPPTVTFKVLADPREGSVSVGSLNARVSETLTLPEGTHRFRYTGDGWTAECEAAIASDVRKIKFEKGTGSCVLLR